MALTHQFDRWAGKVITETRGLRQLAMNMRGPNPLFWRKAIHLMADRLEQFCREIEMDTVARQFEAFRLKVGDGKFTDAELADRVDALLEVFERELIEQWFHRVPTAKREFYNADFGPEVAKAFTAGADDVREANKCFALGRHTAAVFHAMRCVEIGLRALAKERRVTPGKGPIAWQEWQGLIQDIGKNVEADAVKLTKGPRKDDFLEFYHGALREFSGFKNEFRNYVSHSRGSYEEPDARRALTGAKDFMMRLAKRGLTESGKRLRWPK